MLKLLPFILLLGSQTQAAVIFSNFGPGDTANGNGGGGIGSPGPFVPKAYITATQFSVTTTQLFTGADFAIRAVYQNKPQLPVTLTLRTDIGGLPGTTVLEAFTIPGDTLTTTSPYSSFSSLLNPTLLGGTNYWFVAEMPYTPSIYNYASWRYNSIGNQNLTKTAFTDGTPYFTNPNPAPTFRVFGDVANSTVPEPSSALLLLPALAGLAFHHRRRS